MSGIEGEKWGGGDWGYGEGVYGLGKGGEDRGVRDVWFGEGDKVCKCGKW